MDIATGKKKKNFVHVNLSATTPSGIVPLIFGFGFSGRKATKIRHEIETKIDDLVLGWVCYSLRSGSEYLRSSIALPKSFGHR